ncbi:MAG: PAS domain S-box protein [Actinobacteria bacterium]|nr:PAS domain S-box protein [Actinomycetota bacterium]
MDEYDKIRLLLVENEPDAADLIKKLITKKFPAEIDIADSVEKAKTSLKDNSYDIILMDLMLPDGNGLTFTEEITAPKNHPQVIIVTGHGSEEIAAQAFQSGASGYIPKGDELFKLIPQSLKQALDELKRKEAELAVQERESFYRSLFTDATIPMFIKTVDGVIEDVNKAGCDLFGYTVGELKGRTFDHFVKPSRKREFETAFAQLAGGETIQIECYDRNSNTVPVEISGKKITTRKGERLLVTCRDLTRWKKIESALHTVIKETNERREEISALLESTRLVLERKDFKNASKAVFDLCRKLIGAKLGFLALLGEEESDIEVLFMNPKSLLSDSRQIAHMRIQELSASAHGSGKAVFINDYSSTEWGGEVPEHHLPIENILVSPLVVDQKVAGVVALANKPGGFSKENALMASAFGEIISLALRNSRTLEMLQDSEQRFRSVAQNADEAVICIDSEIHIIFWNTAAQTIFGYAPDEILGKDLDAIVPERLHGDTLYPIMQLKGSGKLHSPGKTFELIGLAQDGSEFPIELTRSIWKVRDEFFYTVIVRDITERKEAEKALTESEDLFKTLMMTSPDAVLAINDKNRIMHASIRAAEMFNFDGVDDLLDLRCLELVAQEDQGKAIEAINETKKKGSNSDVELTMVRKDGSRFIGDVNATLIEKDDGTHRAYIIDIRDVTERKRSERELQILNSELESYAHVVSHDLKVPLSSIGAASMTLERLLDDKDDGYDHESITHTSEIIKSSVNKANSLIENLLVLAKSGQQPTDISEVDVSELVDIILREQAENIKRKSIKIEVEPALGEIRANTTHIYQLFNNLIVNAIRHNESENPVIKIRKLEYASGSIHHFLIRDNGKGFDPEQLQSLFLPLSINFNGTRGIGLAIVEKIVNAYDGVITAYNDQGACVDFMLKDVI